MQSIQSIKSMQTIHPGPGPAPDGLIELIGFPSQATSGRQIAPRVPSIIECCHPKKAIGQSIGQSIRQSNGQFIGQSIGHCEHVNHDNSERLAAADPLGHTTRRSCPAQGAEAEDAARGRSLWNDDDDDDDDDDGDDDDADDDAPPPRPLAIPLPQQSS